MATINTISWINLPRLSTLPSLRSRSYARATLSLATSRNKLRADGANPGCAVIRSRPKGASSSNLTRSASNRLQCRSTWNKDNQFHHPSTLFFTYCIKCRFCKSHFFFSSFKRFCQKTSQLLKLVNTIVGIQVSDSVDQRNRLLGYILHQLYSNRNIWVPKVSFVV